MRRRLREVLKRVGRSVSAVVGVDELLIVTGLTLVTAGLWPVVEQTSLVAPGVVLLWIALPQRTSFMAGGSEKRHPPRGDL